MYRNEPDNFFDEKSVNNHSFQSHSDMSCQPSSHQRAFDGNCAPITDHVSCDPSQAEGSGQFYDQDQRYVSDSRAKNGFCKTDETSQYSGDLSMRKPGEELFESRRYVAPFSQKVTLTRILASHSWYRWCRSLRWKPEQQSRSICQCCGRKRNERHASGGRQASHYNMEYCCNQ